MPKFLPLLGWLMLSGCITFYPQTIVPRDLQRRVEVARGVPHKFYCEGLKCKEAWERTQFWIEWHSSRKIQTATDIVIETYGVYQDTVYSYSAVKEPLGSDRYRIRMTAICGSQQGCGLANDQILDVFYYYLKTGDDLLQTESTFETDFPKKESEAPR